MNIAILIQHRTRWDGHHPRIAALNSTNSWPSAFATKTDRLNKVRLALQPRILCYSYSLTGVSAGFSNSFMICARPGDDPTMVKDHYYDQERSLNYSHYQGPNQADGDAPDQEQFQLSALEDSSANSIYPQHLTR